MFRFFKHPVHLRSLISFELISSSSNYSYLMYQHGALFLRDALLLEGFFIADVHAADEGCFTSVGYAADEGCSTAKGHATDEG